MGQQFNRPSLESLADREKLVAPLVAAGLSQAEIQRLTGISQQWISAWLKRKTNDSYVSSKGRSKADRVQLAVRRRQAIEAYQRGMLQSEIARLVGVSRPSVCRWVRAFLAGGIEGLAASPSMGRKVRC